MKQKMQFINRRVFFKNGKALGTAGVLEKECDMSIILSLPTSHYDFSGPIELKGKTITEIQLEAQTYL